MTPPPDSSVAEAQQRSIFSQEGGGGTLPNWAPYGVLVGSLVFCAAVLAALADGYAAVLPTAEIAVAQTHR